MRDPHPSHDFAAGPLPLSRSKARERVLVVRSLALSRALKREREGTRRDSGGEDEGHSSTVEETLNDLDDAFGVRQDIVVPEAQHAEIVVGRPLVANRVTRIVGVLSTIDLDDQTRLAANEIDSVRSDRLLSNELVSAKPPRSEAIPELALGIGRILPKAPCALGLDLSCTTQVASPPHPPRFARRPLPARGERRTYHKSA